MLLIHTHCSSLALLLWLSQKKTLQKKINKYTTKTPPETSNEFFEFSLLLPLPPPPRLLALGDIQTSKQDFLFTIENTTTNNNKTKYNRTEQKWEHSLSKYVMRREEEAFVFFYGEYVNITVHVLFFYYLLSLLSI